MLLNTTAPRFGEQESSSPSLYVYYVVRERSKNHPDRNTKDDWPVTEETVSLFLSLFLLLSQLSSLDFASLGYVIRVELLGVFLFRVGLALILNARALAYLSKHSPIYSREQKTLQTPRKPFYGP